MPDAKFRPDPVEFKRLHPGWVSFPATFVPHPGRSPSGRSSTASAGRWTSAAGPWPTMRKLANPTLFWEGEPIPAVAEVLAIGERSRAERAAAAPPPPIEPQKAYDGDGMGPARDYLTAIAGVGDSLRRAAEDAAFWSAAPSEHMAIPDDVLIRNGAAVLAATRTVEPQPSLFTAAMEGRAGETTEPAAVQLPRGTYHEPLVPLMNRLLAVREGDDMGALRREISDAFYARGDTTGGNQVNMYLSELAEPGLTDAHRREIVDALAHYAKADPEEMGALRRDIIGGVLAGGGAAL